MRCIGKGAESAVMFCGIMNLPPPPTKFNNILLQAARETCEDSMAEAVHEAVEENEGGRDIVVASALSLSPLGIQSRLKKAFLPEVLGLESRQEKSFLFGSQRTTVKGAQRWLVFIPSYFRAGRCSIPFPIRPVSCMLVRALVPVRGSKPGEYGNVFSSGFVSQQWGRVTPQATRTEKLLHTLPHLSPDAP
ncbi:hypothetical protein NPIL_382121 [Nephila pilipes]|uniref:Uncharacterized protein n=1 Tax=Nephila pilipes TaxID=299642 RepID=A0A8X6PLT0_NEPPI|nr:hypothetical protein NPIL_382121 [Nephila pilipes]